jgi:hypothetical protein
MRKKNLAEVLQTDVTTNLPVAALAQIVRSKGRGRDTVLAHITPREAKKLKREGGRGSINPETGLLEFEDDYSFTSFPMSLDYSAAEAPAAMTQVPETVYQQPFAEQYSYGDYQPTYSSGAGGAALAYGSTPYLGSTESAPDFSRFDTPVPVPFAYGGQTVASAPLPVARPASLDATADLGAYRALSTGAELESAVSGQDELSKRVADLEKAKETATPAQKSFLDKLTADPLKLALLLGAGGLGAYQASAARKQAGDVSGQIKALAQEQRTMAQPFLQQGGLQYGLATQGGLTPTNQQQFDVARARLAQEAARTGSVGAMQATQIGEQLRQQAINNQLTQALQILGSGNTVMNSAIANEINALNTRVNLTNQANTAAGNFFTQLAMLYGGTRG